LGKGIVLSKDSITQIQLIYSNSTNFAVAAMKIGKKAKEIAERRKVSPKEVIRAIVRQAGFDPRLNEFLLKPKKSKKFSYGQLRDKEKRKFGRTGRRPRR